MTIRETCVTDGKRVRLEITELSISIGTQALLIVEVELHVRIDSNENRSDVSLQATTDENHSIDGAHVDLHRFCPCCSVEVYFGRWLLRSDRPDESCLGYRNATLRASS